MNLKLILILVTYAVMLFATGYLTFVKFVGLPTVATEEEIKRVKIDPDFKKDLLDDVKASRERNGDLIKLSAHAFDVILGALLGFLSAVAANLGLTGSRSGSTRPPAAPAAQASQTQGQQSDSDQGSAPSGA